MSDEKLQYIINRGAANISLASSKIDEYEYLAAKKLPSNQIQISEQVNFTYSHLGQFLEKKLKMQLENK